MEAPSSNKEETETVASKPRQPATVEEVEDDEELEMRAINALTSLSPGAPVILEENGEISPEELDRFPEIVQEFSRTRFPE